MVKYNFYDEDGFQKEYFVDPDNSDSRDMAVDGSGTAVSFYAPIDTLTHSKLMIAFILNCEVSAGLGALTNFINRAALTNGLQMQAIDANDAVIKTYGEVYCNCDLISYTRNVIEITSTVPTKLYSISFIAPEYPVEVPVGTTRFRIKVQDDLSGITALSASMTVIRADTYRNR